MPVKVLYVHTASSVWSKIIDKLYENDWRAVGYCNLPVSDPSIVHPSLRNVPVYEYENALVGKVPQWLERLPALDHDLVSYIEPYETMLLEMPSRYLPPDMPLDYEGRRDFLYMLIRIWSGVLDVLQPDVMLSASIPHRFVDNVLYFVCQHRGVPTLYPEMTRLPNCHYVTDVLVSRHRRFDNMGDEHHALADHLAEYCALQKQNYEAAKPAYQSPTSFFTNRKLSAKERLKRWLALRPSLHACGMLLSAAIGRRLSRRILRYAGGKNSQRQWITEWRCIISSFKQNRAVLDAKRYYERIALTPDLSRPYVYFAPHYQPERSSCPDAGLYHDMRIIAQVLEHSLPEGWVVYYKEHPRSVSMPSMFGNPRTVAFYKMLQEYCPRMQFIPIDCDPFELIDNAKCTATGTGTSALQSLLRGRPALIFGDVAYSSAPGAFRVTSFADCQRSIKIISEGVRVPESELLQFIAGIGSETHDYEFYFKDLVCARMDSKACAVDEYSEQGIQYLVDELISVYESGSRNEDARRERV